MRSSTVKGGLLIALESDFDDSLLVISDVVMDVDFVSMAFDFLALIEFDLPPITPGAELAPGFTMVTSFEGCTGAPVKPSGVLRVVTVETMVLEVGIKVIDDGWTPCFERDCLLV